jgi:hypothetical protein
MEDVEMTAEQLIQQYPGAITARELVEGVWVDAKCFKEDRYHPAKDGTWVDYVIRCYDNRIDLVCMASKAAAWAAAADFTISRIEEIRQVKEEIALLRGLVILLNEEPGDLSTPAWLRVITREQSALAELIRGVRPEVLA